MAEDEAIEPSKLKVAELKEHLTARGLSTKGLKKELQERLQAHLDSQGSGHQQKGSPAAQDTPEVQDDAKKTELQEQSKEATKDVQEDVENIMVKDALNEAGDQDAPAGESPAKEIHESDHTKEQPSEKTLPPEPSNYKFSEGKAQDAEKKPGSSTAHHDGAAKPEADTLTKSHSPSMEVQAPEKNLVQTTLDGEKQPATHNEPVAASDMQIEAQDTQSQDDKNQTRLSLEAPTTSLTQSIGQDEAKDASSKRRRSVSRSRSRSPIQTKTSSYKKQRRSPSRSLTRSRSVSRSRSRSRSRGYDRRRSRSRDRRNDDDRRRPRSYTRSPSPAPRRRRSRSASQSDRNATTPPSSASLYIANLVRPFMLPTLKEMLSEFGEIDFFWIDNVKSHVYLTYKRESSAISAMRALNGMQWPANTGKNLALTFLPTSRVESLVSEEDQAKILRRGRLELVVDRNNSEWEYRLVPFGTAPQTQSLSSVISNGVAVPMRGLASAVPLQARGISIAALPLASQLNSRTERIPLTGSNGIGGGRESFGRSREPPFRGGRGSDDRPISRTQGAMWTKTRPSIPYKPYKEL